MIQHKDLEVSAYEISLTKLIGKKIKEVRGYLSNPYIDEPLFQMTKIEFEDGTFLGAGGEHDFPYLVTHGGEQPNYDDETLARLYREANPEEQQEGEK